MNTSNRAISGSWGGATTWCITVAPAPLPHLITPPASRIAPFGVKQRQGQARQSVLWCFCPLLRQSAHLSNPSRSRSNTTPPRWSVFDFQACSESSLISENSGICPCFPSTPWKSLETLGSLQMKLDAFWPPLALTMPVPSWGHTAGWEMCTHIRFNKARKNSRVATTAVSLSGSLKRNLPCTLWQKRCSSWELW